MSLTVATVLKSGGDFDHSYVWRLAAGVARNLKQSHRFVCLTDNTPADLDQLRAMSMGGRVYWLPLVRDYPGWWSKMELFSLPGPLLYFDLDTVIVGALDPLADQIYKLGRRVMMLRGFHMGDWTSGIMGWYNPGEEGRLDWLLELFMAAPKEFFARDRLKLNGRSFRGDQDYIREVLDSAKYHPRTELVAVQDLVRGIYSYKVHVRQRPGQELPEDAAVVAFHGRPRPKEVERVPAWLRLSWT